MRHPKSTPESRKAGVEFAWHAHSAITDWTAKVDSKASIVLSLGGAVLGFFVTLSASHRALAGLLGWRLLVERAGFLAVALSVFGAALVVAPRLNRRQSKQAWKQNFLYFGHLRHWKPEELKKRLEVLDGDQELNLLSQQLVATSKIAWFKHSLVQLSIWALVAGVIMVVLASAYPQRF